MLIQINFQYLHEASSVFFMVVCKANGSKPLRYQWLKDGLPSIQRRLQPRLKTNMWYLKLKDLVTVDSGRYTCVVSNPFGSINHTYTLRVVGMISSSDSSKVRY